MVQDTVPPSPAPAGEDPTRPSEVFQTALTTPTAPRVHGSAPRGIDVLPTSSFHGGRFGRMFRNVPVFEHSPDQLAAIAAKMVQDAKPEDTEPVPVPEPEDDDENPVIPSGYTYLGQFIDHDITFDPASSLTRQNDPDSLDNFRTPRYDLDNLYGRGPSDEPYLYRNGPEPILHPTLGFDERGVTFLLGENRADPGDPAQAPFVGPDVQRNADGRAIIGDPRNDENLIVSQLVVLFQRFHNRMVERAFTETGLQGDNLFKEAQRRVRWHYQWIVTHDFLPRIVDGDPGDGSTTGKGIVDDILRVEKYRVGVDRTAKLVRPRLLFYRPAEQAYIPVEFSVAAYRFGHSMVRPSYFFNDFVKGATGNTRTALFSDDPNPLANLNGNRPLPGRWGFQWKFFFDVDPATPAQRSYKIDTELVNPLGSLRPDVASPDRSLAHRNLVRGLRLGVPSGQNVARAMGITPLGTDELGLVDVAPEFAADTPLWFYILKEAEVGGSTHLGAVGGRIVAEVLIGLLYADPLSYLRVAPSWVPDLAVDGRFGMPELIRFVEQTDTPPASG
ncbi:MAG: myeloperoxidase thyroid peroxidase cyclooxygenase catalytic subunit [Mycobacterium sp.]|nr:myeloperoxidase thyroid peroxidase cyclooxygenase catalytic subunit [Mycobacterium sp.]